MSLGEDAETLNRILGDEQGAVEAYELVLESSAAYPQIWGLHQIAEDHRQAVGLIKRQIEALGVEPRTTDGGRLWARTWSAVKRDRERKLFEDLEALLALREGELQGVEQCRWAIRKESAYAPVRNLVRDQVMPMLLRHVQIIDTYLSPLQKSIPPQGLSSPGFMTSSASGP